MAAIWVESAARFDFISLIFFPCADITSPIFFSKLLSVTRSAPIAQTLASPP